jgi:hypothetical protein
MPKVNPKNFTLEQIESIWRQQNLRCDNCGRICCGTSGGEDYWGQVHHKKKKSHLSKREIEELGPGGGTDNGVGLCQECHTMTENNDPKMAKYRTKSFQKIGERESDFECQTSRDSRLPGQ